MNKITYRILIISVVALNLFFVFGSPSSIYVANDGIYYFSNVVRSIAYGTMFISMVGLFFFINFFRYVFLGALIFCLLIVFLDGSVKLTNIQNIILQVGSAVYGSIIAIAFLGDFNWIHLRKQT